MFCSPEYRITRLKGIPSQMLAMVTEASEWSALSHHTGSTPRTPSSRLMIPESASIIHCQVVAETMMGSNHGTRNSPRRTAESGKLRRKNTARAIPITYWAASDPMTKNAVCRTVGQNWGEAKISRYTENPTNGAFPVTNVARLKRCRLIEMFSYNGYG